MPNEAKLGLVVGIVLTIVLAVCFKPSAESAAIKPFPTTQKAVQGQTTSLHTNPKR
jgi:hypothetical protein